MALEKRLGADNVLASPEDQMAKSWQSRAVEEKVTLLEDAFRRLLPGGSAAADDVTISGIGRSLWLAGPHVSRDDECRASWPLSPAEKGRARNQVRKAATAMGKLTPEVAYAMGLDWGEIYLVRAKLFNAAARAKPALGAPKKDQARKIATIVALHYWALTGKKPTVPKRDGKAYGPFLDLVTTVFKILGAKASPLSAAESASRRWNGATQAPGRDYGI